jgi:hypothetical protein
VLSAERAVRDPPFQYTAAAARRVDGGMMPTVRRQVRDAVLSAPETCHASADCSVGAGRRGIRHQADFVDELGVSSLATGKASRRLMRSLRMDVAREMDLFGRRRCEGGQQQLMYP